jgi:hypothetical protein
MKIHIAAAILLSFTLTAKSSYIDLSSFGTGVFSIDDGITTATSLQSDSGITYSSIGLGNTLGGEFSSGPFDWSAYSDFAIQMSFSGANPNVSFTVEFFNADFTVANVYQGDTSDILAGGYVPFSLMSGSPAVLPNIGGIQLTWDGSASGTITTTTVAAVPEPSTYALLALAVVGLGGYVFRRRLRA